MTDQTALPGMADAILARIEAEAQTLRDQMNEIMRQPLRDISGKAGNIERDSPLFFGNGENPSLF
jgi:hypothetical protein